MGTIKTSFRTFKEWSAQLLASYAGQELGNRSWFTVGEWLINAKENDSYEEERVAYHVCEDNYKRMCHSEIGDGSKRKIAPSVSDIEIPCQMCGAPVPDGIKMIALLEKI